MLPSPHHAARGLAFLAVFALGTIAVSAQTPASPVAFSGQLVSLNPQLNLPPQTPLDITITRWSTVDEREQLVTVLKTAGGKGLLEMMQSAPRIGSIRIPGTLNYEFHFAMRSQSPDGGEFITLIADRPVGFAEAVDGPRTLEYRFMVLQLQVNPIGRGEGRLSVVTRISADRVTGEINLETWEDFYATLRDVRRTSR